MSEVESIIKYNFRLSNKSIEMPCIDELNFWRRQLHNAQLVGVNERGEGYGNLSQLLPPYDSPENNKVFVITGSQSGHLEDLTKEHYAIVTGYSLDDNVVEWQNGPIKPSSESMTHGSIYDMDEKIRFVFHTHSPFIWNKSASLGIPSTNVNAGYGTPEMAKEIEKIFGTTDVKEKKIFSMGGHKDGMFTFGETASVAGGTILRYLREAYRS